MKKLMIILALVAMALPMGAQTKSLSAAKSAVDAAQKAADDEKKATKVATWMKLGQALSDAYNAPRGEAWVGASKQELELILGSQKPVKTETVELGGATLTKDVFPTHNYYYSENGTLAMIEATEEAVPDALERAAAAYAKAAELDVKEQKKEDITNAMNAVVKNLSDEAYNAYTFGDFAKASAYFEKSADASSLIAYIKYNTEALYNAAFTANMIGEFDRAKALFQKCIDNGYDGDKGEAYAKIAEIAVKQGNDAESKDVLEAGFLKYPDSQSILIGLINYYLTSNGSTDRLFELLAGAKKNEPNNASLYYVEGNIHKQLGQIDEALAAYDQCSAINPSYEFGYIAKGQYYYEKAIELQEAANNEMDDAKWNELVKQFEASLKACVEPFEKAYEISTAEDIKTTVAEYLKNACFRFRDDPEFAAKYEKYSK